MRIVVATIAVLAALPTLAQSERPLVYVADVEPASPKLAQEAAALTTSLCGAVAKEKRVEVLCAPDVKQILSFAAMGSMAGAANPAATSLQTRMATIGYVVTGTLTSTKKDKDDVFTLVIAAGKKAEEADALTPYVEAATIRLEEQSVGKSTRLLDRLPEISGRVMKALLAPPPTTTPPPPEPLKKTTP